MLMTLSRMADLVIFILLFDYIAMVDVLHPKYRILKTFGAGNDKYGYIKRNGIFQKIEETQPTTSPTMVSDREIENFVHEYIDLAKKTASSDTSHTSSVSDGGTSASPKLNLSQPEPFSKPTPIPPIGSYLMTSSPRQSIQPIKDSFEKQKKLASIKDQFTDTKPISRIKEIPQIADIDSIDNVFQDDTMDDVKRYVILANEDRGIDVMDLYKRLHHSVQNYRNTRRKRSDDNFPSQVFKHGMQMRNRYVTTEKQGKRQNTPMLIAHELTINELRHRIKKLLSIKKNLIRKPKNINTTLTKRFWSPNVRKGPNEVFVIASRLTRDRKSLKLKDHVHRVMLGNRKVFIPPPPPIQMKSLESFEKAKEIEDIGANSIKIEDPQSIDNIDQHSITIDKQQEITPIDNHVIDNDNIEPIDDIKPVPKIQNVIT